MTSSKRRREHKYRITRTAAATQERAERALEQPLGLKDYMLLNVVFDAFCIVQLIIVSMLMDEMPGLVFFFVFIMVSFLIMSAFDYMASRLATDNVAGAKAATAHGESA